MEVIKAVIEGSKCDQSMIHKTEGRLAYLCYAPRCSKRLVCDRCLLSDSQHVEEHRPYIKTIPEFEKNILEALDSSSVESTIRRQKGVLKQIVEQLKLVRERVKKKFQEHVKSVIENVFSDIFSQLQKIFESIDIQLNEYKSNFKTFGDDSNLLSEASK